MRFEGIHVDSDNFRQCLVMLQPNIVLRKIILTKTIIYSIQIK